MGVIAPARRYAVLIGASAALTALVPANCTASVWAAPQTLGPTSQAPGGPRLAGDSKGHAILVWQTPGDSLRYAIAPAGRGFGPSRRLSRSGGDASPVVTMDSRGDAIVAWTYNDRAVELEPESRGGGTACCDHVRVALIRADGTVRRSETLTPPDTSAKVISTAISEDGSAISVLYTRASITHETGEASLAPARLLVASASSSGPFGRAVILGPPTTAESLPAVVRAQAHQVSVIYCTFASPPPHSELPTTTFHESVLSLSGRSLHAMVLGRRGNAALAGSHGGLDPSFDRRGELAVLMETAPELSEPRRRHPRRPELVVATIQPGSPLHSQAVRAIPRPVAGRSFYSPTLAVAPSGRALLAWSAGYEDDRIGVATGRLPDASFRAAAVLKPLLPNRAVQSIALAVNDAGEAVLALVASGSEGQETHLAVITRTSSGSLAAPVNLAKFGEYESFDEPQAVIDARGRGVVVWLGEGGLLQARRFQIR